MTACTALLLLLPSLTTGAPPEVTWPEAAYNPNPLPDDLILAMPCGGAMAFRAVSTGPDGTFDDLELELGNDDLNQGFAERRYRAFVSGPFPDENERHLLMGKYEVNNLQYQTLVGHGLEQTCPRPGDEPIPALTGVGWHEATRFAHLYSLWLARNANRIPPCKPGPESGPPVSEIRDPIVPCLPMQDGIPAFVRLPTEAEWEFAARGGRSVSASEFRATIYPVPEGLERHTWFNENADGEIKPIGLRRPNPLGLHDMLGNAEEMVLEPFRLRVADRSHGQAGGFVVRGGSIRSTRGEMRTSLRREVPHYDLGGAVRTADTGFRLLASLPVFTSRERLTELRSAWTILGKQDARVEESVAAESPPRSDPPVDAGPAGPTSTDPLLELSALVRATRDPDRKRRLERLYSLAAAERRKLYEQRLRAATEGLRFGGLTCSKLHDEGHNLGLLQASLQICIDNRGADFPRCTQRAEQIGRDERILRDNIRFHADTVVRTAQSYSDDPQVLDRAFEDLAASLVQRGYADLKIYPSTFLLQVQAYAGGAGPQADTWFQQCRDLR